MDFELAEEHLQIRSTVRGFAEKEIIPFADEWDREEHFPKEVIVRMGKLGFFGAAFPQKYGGTELGYLANAIVAEELGRASLGVAGACNMQSGTCPMTILNWGTEEQKQKYLPAIISCEALGCFGLTEPNAATDMAGMQTTAILKNNKYIINGSKTWITQATVFDVGILFAKTNPKERHKGISAFLLLSNLPGLTRQKLHDKLGMRCSDTGQLFFDNCELPRENLLGEEGRGFTVAESSLVYGRTSVGARALGVAQACLDAGIKYANEREQFGQKIGYFQLVKEQLADMVADVEAARLLVYKSASLIDIGRASRRQADIAKFFASEACLRAAINVSRIYGAYQYSQDFPVARYYRDATLACVAEGSSNMQRILIANDALGWKRLD
jgi:glutaryl-CoA dehydrogenase (non-decarboxylating)